MNQNRSELMNEDIRNLRHFIQDATLQSACQAIALELRQDMMYAKMSFELFTTGELDAMQAQELRNAIQNHLDRALTILNDIFVPEILHSKIRDRV